MPFEATLCAGMPAICSPTNSMVPLVGWSCPEMVFRVVDLPAPFAPMSVTISPSWTSTLMPLSASILP